MELRRVTAAELGDLLREGRLVLLVACSKAKRLRAPSRSRAPEPLPRRAAELVEEYRALVLHLARPRGPWAPACMLYAGHLYRRVSLEAWLRARSTYVVSAAYGILHPWELVRSYELSLAGVPSRARELLRRAILALAGELGAEAVAVAGLGLYRGLLRGAGYALEVLERGKPVRGVAGSRYYGAVGEALDAAFTGEPLDVELVLVPA